MVRLDPRFRQSRVSVATHIDVPPRLHADIIIVHFTVSWRKLLWLRWLRQRNTAATLILVEHSYTRCFEQIHVAHRARFRMMLRLVCCLMDRVVTVSEAQGDWLAEAARPPAGKLLVINPHTDLSGLRLLPPPQHCGGPLSLCGYGRYASQKGFDTLIEAMRLVPREVACLRLVGLGPERQNLVTQAGDLPQVTIDGPVSGPDLLLGAVDAVAIPSRFEAFGNVALEARAAARPIIVSDVDGLTAQALKVPELVVPAEDPPALARAICWLAQQDITLLGMGARRSVAGAEAHTIDRWNGLFAEIAATRRKKGLLF